MSHISQIRKTIFILLSLLLLTNYMPLSSLEASVPIRTSTPIQGLYENLITTSNQEITNSVYSMDSSKINQHTKTEILSHSTITKDVYSTPQQLPDLSVTKEVYSNINQPKPSLKRVSEVTEKRTPNSKHYLLEDGSYEAVITLHSQHYEAIDGHLYEITTELTDEADIITSNGQLSKQVYAKAQQVATFNNEKRKEIRDKSDSNYTALRLPFNVSLPKKISKGYSISKDSETIKFIPIDATNVTGYVYGSNKDKMYYPNVWADADIELALQTDGIKETVILHSAKAPTSFSFKVEGDLIDKLSSKQFSIMPAWLKDARGTFRNVKQTLRVDKGTTYIDLNVDTQGLVYPIEVDPTIILPVNSAAVYETETETFYWGFTDWMGYITVGYDPGNSGYTWEPAFRFDLSSIPVNHLNEAKLRFNYTNNSQNSTHKVYRLTSPSNPAYTTTNAATFNIPLGNNVWAEADVTQLTRDLITTNNYGYFINSGTRGNGNYFGAAIKNINYSDPSLRPQLQVSYNAPPQAPTVNTPNGGEVIDTNYLISWTPAVDYEQPQSSLRYHIELSINGGASWMNLVTLTDPGATSYNYNFGGIGYTNNALIRIQATDGTFYGPFDTSNGFFTIDHNHAPYVPTSTTPGSPNSGSPQLLTYMTPALNWVFSDPDGGDYQTAYEINIFNSGNTLIYNSYWISSGVTSYTIPSDVLQRGTTYYWKVRSKDSKGAISGYSSNNFLRINSLPTQTITSYYDGQSLNDKILTFTWNYADSEGHGQTNYQVVGSKDNWATWAYNSGEIASSSTTHTTSTLEAGTWSFAVRVRDGYEWSNWSYRISLLVPSPVIDTQAPSVPSNLAVINKTNTTISLSWIASTDNVGVASYDIYNGETYAGSSLLTTYTLTGITFNTSYSFTVKAKDAAGNVSGASNVVTVITPILSKKSNYYYDSSGKLDFIQLEDGTIIDYQYDANGNLLKIVKEESTY